MKKNTKKSFYDKWNNNKDKFFDDILKRGSNTQNWILERNGFFSLEDFESHLSNKKRILDAGCGNGRVAALLQSIAPNRCKLVGVDLVSSEIAKSNLNKFNNIEIYEKDLMDPLPDLGKFDFIYCQEVLHHTLNPRIAFNNLYKILIDGGEIAIYVYKKKAPVREFVDDYIRNEISTLEYDAAYDASKNITDLGKILSELDIKIVIPAIPQLKIDGGEYDIQRFFYHFFMKCHWNTELSYDENVAVNYDWYHPQTCSRHSMDEVVSWFEDVGLNIIHKHKDHYGITIRGIK